jgi:glucokinase
MQEGADAQETLVADVGGTNTRVALARGAKVLHPTLHRFDNTAFGSLEDVLRAYLQRTPQARGCRAICVAVAGPVGEGWAQMTNLDWRIEAQSLADVTGAGAAFILNDLQAQAHALPHLPGEATQPLLDMIGTPRAGARLVVGIGTGFNAALLLPGPPAISPASECGHVNMVVTDAADLALREALTAAHGYASVEDVLSGRGLEGCYRHAAGTNAAPLDAAGVVAAIAAGTPAACDAARLFARQAGAVVGNLALTHLPFGGIYLAGGVARAMAPHLLAHGFTDTFRAKGRFTEFMGQFAVRLVTDDYAALIGCGARVAESLGANLTEAPRR